jgi:hypothetical protein
MRSQAKLVGYVVLAVLVCLTLLRAGPARAVPGGRDAFEGKWAVEVTPEDGGKAYKDTLIFKGQKLTSEKLKKEGFEEAEYEVDLRGGQIGTFTANAKSKTGGTAKWSGTAATGNLQGTLVLTKKDGSATNYTFTGAKANQ